MKNSMSFVAATAQLFSKHPAMRVSTCEAVNYIGQRYLSAMSSDKNNSTNKNLQDNLKEADLNIKNSMECDYTYILESPPSQTNKYFMSDKKEPQYERISELKKDRDDFANMTKKDRTSLFSNSKRVKDTLNSFSNFIVEEKKKGTKKDNEGPFR